MVAVADVVDALGGGLLRTLVPAPGVAVTDVVIAEPGDAAADLRGDLVIGAGVADATDAVELIELAGRGRCRRGDPAPRRGPRSRCPSRGEALRRRPAGAGRLGLARSRGRRDPGDRRPCRRSGLRAGRPRRRGGPPRARRRGRGPGRRPGDHRGRAVACRRLLDPAGRHRHRARLDRPRSSGPRAGDRLHALPGRVPPAGPLRRTVPRPTRSWPGDAALRRPGPCGRGVARLDLGGHRPDRRRTTRWPSCGGPPRSWPCTCSGTAPSPTSRVGSPPSGSARCSVVDRSIPPPRPGCRRVPGARSPSAPPDRRRPRSASRATSTCGSPGSGDEVGGSRCSPSSVTCPTPW